MKKLLFIILGVLLTSGCVQLYKIPEGQSVAFVESRGMGELQMCKNGEFYRLPKVKDGLYKVPVDGKVTLSKFVYIDGYMVSYSCNPAVSFEPDTDEQYIANLEFLTGGCFIELVKKDDDKEVGVSFVDSIGQPSCD